MPCILGEFGMYNVVCHPFPRLDHDYSPLLGRICHLIEPYDHLKMISVFVKRDNNGSIIKITDENANEVDPRDTNIANKSLMMALNIQKLTQVEESQLFFADDGKEPMLVDVYNGSDFISAGMLRDIYGKRMRTQNILKTEQFNPSNTKNVIVKPAVVRYVDSMPLYSRV